MKRKGIFSSTVLFIVSILLVNLIMISGSIQIAPNLVTEPENSSTSITELTDVGIDYYIPTNFSWTAASIDNANINLASTTSGDFFQYTINDTFVHLFELDTYNCLFGVYATIPVINDHVKYSCEVRAKTINTDIRVADITFFDPVTLNPLPGRGRISSPREGVLLDTDFDYVGVEFDLKGYSEIIMFIFINDGYATDNQLECWFRNLRIYVDEDLPLRSYLPAPVPMDAYNWNFDTYQDTTFADPIPPLIPLADGEFTYEVNSTHIHVAESGAGTYNRYVGASVTIPVSDDFVIFSFEGMTETDGPANGNIKVRVYDPITKERIIAHPGTNCGGRIPGETGDYDYVEYNFTISGYSEVIIFFGYRDTSSGNDGLKFWIKNFRHEILIDDQIPEILSVDEITFNVDSTGNFINCHSSRD